MEGLNKKNSNIDKNSNLEKVNISGLLAEKIDLEKKRDELYKYLDFRHKISIFPKKVREHGGKAKILEEIEKAEQDITELESKENEIDLKLNSMSQEELLKECSLMEKQLSDIPEEINELKIKQGKVRLNKEFDAIEREIETKKFSLKPTLEQQLKIIKDKFIKSGK